MNMVTIDTTFVVSQECLMRLENKSQKEKKRSKGVNKPLKGQTAKNIFFQRGKWKLGRHLPQGPRGN